MIEKQHQALAEWLTEWKLEETLSCDDCRVPAAVNDSADKQSRLYRGQIRLLQPAVCEAAAHKPRYILLHKIISKKECIVIPFGTLGVPAIPGEWKTSDAAQPLRILCLWNSRRCLSALIRKSWLVTRWPEKKSAAIQKMLELFLSPPEVALMHLPDCGPPLLHPADPRYQYLAQESDALVELGPHLTAGNRSGVNRFFTGCSTVTGERKNAIYPFPVGNKAKAAETTNDYPAE